MSKALVISGADFSTNKIETITLEDPIPCTGIALSQSSMSATSLGVVGTLTATLTPSDTTDQVVWTSSDTDIATVADGVVTAVGLGTATITATCGNQSATCSVSVAVVLSVSDLVNVIGGTANTTKSQFEGGRDYTGLSLAESPSKYVAIASPTQTASGYKALSGDNALYDGKYPIMIPNNATTVKYSTSAQITGVSTVYMDSSEHPTATVASKGTKIVAYPSSVWGDGPTVTFPTDVSGLDSFVAFITFKDAVSEIPSDLTLTFE